MKRATKTISFRVNHEVAGLIETARKPFGLSAGEYVRGIITHSLDSFGSSSTESDLIDIRQAMAELTAENMALHDANSSSLLVKPDVARRQFDREIIPPPQPPPTEGDDDDGDEADTGTRSDDDEPIDRRPTRLKRFHGTVALDEGRVGRDAGRIADEVIAHLVGQVGAEVTVTLEIEATLPQGASDQVVRTVTENSRTLKFTTHGFEHE